MTARTHLKGVFINHVENIFLHQHAPIKKLIPHTLRTRPQIGPLYLRLCMHIQAKLLNTETCVYYKEDVVTQICCLWWFCVIT